MRKQPNRAKRYNTKPKDFISRINNGEFLYFYKSKEWKDKRIEALSRDKYECQRCKGKFDNIEEKTLTTAVEVHHILCIKERPELCLQLSNLVSLCHDCHDHVEKRFNNRKTRDKVSLTSELW